MLLTRDISHVVYLIAQGYDPNMKRISLLMDLM